jgi:biotin carboxylase
MARSLLRPTMRYDFWRPFYQSEAGRSMSEAKNPTMVRKRLLLLVTPSTYRAEAFCAAADKLDVEVVRGLDLPPELAEQWGVPLAVHFADSYAATNAIVAYAKEHPLDAIIAVDDSATLIAARAGAALGLAHNPPGAAEAARDKGIMRNMMDAAGVPCPVFRRFSLAGDPDEIAQQVDFPCVVKPLRLSGSRGVIRADDPRQFTQAFKRLKRILLGDGYPLGSTDVLVEDFIPGVEVALEGLLTNGDMRTLTIFDKPDPLDGPFFEETIYTTPSRLPKKTQRAISDTAAAAARSIGLRDGPVHAEMRVNNRGPWMLEIAGRSIGGLCSTILEFGAGMSLEELILRNALRMETPSADLATQAAGVMMIPIPKGGMLHTVSGVEEARATPRVEGVEISVKPHTEIVPLPEGASYLGFIFARAETPAEAEAAIRAAHAHLRFDIRPLLSLVPKQRQPA